MAKYNQIENKYSNNEYENMPSIYNMGERLTTKSKDLVNWDKVNEIVKKYNLKYTLINSTFGCYEERGVYTTDFILYFKVFIDEDWYQEKLKNKEYDILNKWTNAERLFFKLFHECVHELDEETELHFDTGWAGNVGFFGSDDVSRQSYSFGDSLTSWATITDRYSPLIHDTNRKLSKGVYIMMSSNHLKKNI
jgi:hypothetical protein